MVNGIMEAGMDTFMHFTTISALRSRDELPSLPKRFPVSEELTHAFPQLVGRVSRISLEIFLGYEKRSVLPVASTVAVQTYGRWIGQLLSCLLLQTAYGGRTKKIINVHAGQVPKWSFVLQIKVYPILLGTQDAFGQNFLKLKKKVKQTAVSGDGFSPDNQSYPGRALPPSGRGSELFRTCRSRAHVQIMCIHEQSNERIIHSYMNKRTNYTKSHERLNLRPPPRSMAISRPGGPVVPEREGQPITARSPWLDTPTDGSNRRIFRAMPLGLSYQQIELIRSVPTLGMPGSNLSISNCYFYPELKFLHARGSIKQPSVSKPLTHNNIENKRQHRVPRRQLGLLKVNSKWKYCDRPKIENRNGASEKLFLIHIYSESLPEQVSVCPCKPQLWTSPPKNQTAVTVSNECRRSGDGDGEENDINGVIHTVKSQNCFPTPRRNVNLSTIAGENRLAGRLLLISNLPETLLVVLNPGFQQTDQMFAQRLPICKIGVVPIYLVEGFEYLSKIQLQSLEHCNQPRCEDEKCLHEADDLKNDKNTSAHVEEYG
ncbi:unnamed protein product [Nesidiocoris tenuis]|uniref:Uncharacterized protein n=1 Tax=Nesidiocoris tenuis TaxID=355587 RepID=A0A6H5GCY2_9HEMI|nr:unnamed protein product [Nesidiocoris tenuis]